MVTDSPKVALIGCGRWGRNIARVLSRLGALHVIVDPSVEALRDYARELEATLSSHLDDAFAADIDAVAIAAPAVDHAKLVLTALRAGKHVFVEKPLTLDLDEADACQREADERGLTLTVGHLLQYHPAFVRFRSIVEAGEIGELRHIVSNRLNPGAIRTEENALWSMAPHDFSMVLALAGGEPTRVDTLPVRVIDPAVPDQYHVSLTFETVTAQVNVSWLSPFKEHKLIAVGTTGAVVFEDTAADPSRKLTIYRNYIETTAATPRFVKGPGESVSYPAGEPLEEEMRAFLEAVRSGVPAVTAPTEAIPVLRLLHRAQTSADAF